MQGHEWIEMVGQFLDAASGSRGADRRRMSPKDATKLVSVLTAFFGVIAIIWLIYMRAFP